MEEGLESVTTENMTSSPEVQPGPSYDPVIRKVAFFAVFVLGFVGNIGVFVWIFQHRKEKTRFHIYILFLAISDLSVLFFPILGELIYELKKSPEWMASNFACKTFRLAESVALFSSTFMLAGIAIDRFHSVINALKKQLSEVFIISLCWCLAIFLSLPQLVIFSKRDRVNNTYFCMTPFRLQNAPPWWQPAYIFYITAIAYIAPLCIMTFTYSCILHRLWMGQGSNMFQTKSSWQRKSRWRTLKMTFVIIGVYIICQTPYFVIEVMQALQIQVGKKLYGVMAMFAVCNSTANPYVFLFFNVKNNPKGYQQGGKTQQTSVQDQSQVTVIGPNKFNAMKSLNGAQREEEKKRLTNDASEDVRL